MEISWNTIWYFVRMAVECLLITFVIYKFLYYLRGTRAVNVLAGLLVAYLLLYIVAETLKLSVLSWLMRGFAELMAFAIIVIFQSELRRAFAQLGSWGIFRFFQRNRKHETINELVAAVNSMAGRRCGAIIVIERHNELRAIVEDAVKLDCKLNNLLLQSIFYPNSPLHDGAVIIRGDHIVAARAILPLSRDANLVRTMGTRHRAALGIAEETDAVVVVVSEETGDISVACHGSIMRGLSGKLLEDELNRLLKSSETLTDILDPVDEPEGEVNYHGDEEFARNSEKPEVK